MLSLSRGFHGKKVRINTCYDDEIAVPLVHFDLGWRFLISWEHVEVFNHCGIIPAQLPPNSITSIYSFVIYLRTEGITFSLDVFKSLFLIRSLKEGKRAELLKDCVFESCIPTFDNLSRSFHCEVVNATHCISCRTTNQEDGYLSQLNSSCSSVTWNQIANTVWWQDFPRRDTPDYSSLFTSVKDSTSDFAAQLAGFIASLIIDVSSQAH
ncbi:hypothetical protein KSP39_PZI018822 [Platanthera zijinensis]|uniref:Uncharacterized protein n=1 Tax=Platanthera zijinensis TaxID=2320716 RepID=A0AAP0FZ28_9ASPA